MKRSTISAVFFCLISAAFPLYAFQTADILFTHDTHSQLDSEARAASIIKKVRADDPAVFLFDAGDFSMGTLYQMLYRTEASELRILGMLGTDVTTLGNHEFDYGSDGLHDMLEAALKSGDTLPRIVLCNADWKHSQPGAARVKLALDDYGAVPYTVIEKNGIRIAVFGIFGKNALFCAPTCQVAFDDQIRSARKTVASIKAAVRPDMIVCVSHSGTNARKSKSEDELLAEKVPSIDVIISGHSHTALAVPVVHGATYVVSCGAYSANIGHMVLSRKTDGRWGLKKYELIPVGDAVPEDPIVRARLDEFREDIDQKHLSRYGLRSNEIIARNDDILSEQDVGYVMADCIRDAVKELEVPAETGTFTGYGKPVDFACVPSGCLRGTYAPGAVAVKDVFRSFSLGTGPDGLTGYPLVSVWLTGKDIKSALELDASLSPFMDTVSLFFSGLAFTYNPRRLFLDKVETCMIIRPDGSAEHLADGRLYRCTADIYTARMMKSVLGVTKGMVQIVPRDASGTPVHDFTKQIIYTGAGELKGWYAIAYAMKKRGVIAGYEGARGRMKRADPSISLAAALSHPSRFACIVYSMLALVFVLIACICTCMYIRSRKHFRKRI